MFIERDDPKSPLTFWPYYPSYLRVVKGGLEGWHWVGSRDLDNIEALWVQLVCSLPSPNLEIRLLKESFCSDDTSCSYTSLASRWRRQYRKVHLAGFRIDFGMFGGFESIKHSNHLVLLFRFGDKDLQLELANPLHLRAVLEHPNYTQCRVVLLHGSYPFMREASYLASVYPQVKHLS